MLPWFLRDLLGRAPIHLAYLCTTHPETGWLRFDDWARHVNTAHPRERAAMVNCSFRNSERCSDGSLRLGRMIRHSEGGAYYAGLAHQ